MFARRSEATRRGGRVDARYRRGRGNGATL